MLGPPPFKTRDKVRLKSGKSPIQVLEVDYFDCAGPSTTPRWKKRNWSSSRRPRKGWYIRFAYLSSLHYGDDYSRSWREAEDFVHFDTGEDPTMAQSILYQTKEETPRFGTFLTRTSTGKIALEMKGSGGEVETFDKNQIEEVTPHTVLIQRFQGGDNNGELRHYEMKPGVVNVDDVLIHLSTGALYKVVRVDTKQKSARQSKNGFFKLEGSFVTTDN